MKSHDLMTTLIQSYFSQFQPLINQTFIATNLAVFSFLLFLFYDLQHAT